MMYAYRMQQLLRTRYHRGVITGRQKTLAVTESKQQMQLAVACNSRSLTASWSGARERGSFR